ncbi:hypothetical protein COH35_12370 [Neisseria meningitidis]|nr:hypothetical protein CGC62_12090 [Neisseria meningitidis]RNJ88590.1 hypothetical protein COI34_12805 [Neisseria meningitidis]RNL11542.1 hypothetical protein COH85_12410 [Neisseria meningitidis]RQK37180.1 hypothetical protein COH70_12425 [Neisseria meningitidis]RQK43181.1 hypothetical protein COH68_12310 [Neisseria meningitidis]
MIGGLKPTLVYRNSRIIATNRPAATRAHPRHTTVAQHRERQGNPSTQPDSCRTTQPNARQVDDEYPIPLRRYSELNLNQYSVGSP